MDEHGREVLSFIPGDAAHYPLPQWVWDPQVLHDAGALLRPRPFRRFRARSDVASETPRAREPSKRRPRPPIRPCPAAGQVPLRPLLPVQVPAGFAEPGAGVQFPGPGVGRHHQQPVARHAPGVALTQQRPDNPAAIAAPPGIRPRRHAVQATPAGPAGARRRARRAVRRRRARRRRPAPGRTAAGHPSRMPRATASSAAPPRPSTLHHSSSHSAEGSAEISTAGSGSPASGRRAPPRPADQDQGFGLPGEPFLIEHGVERRVSAGRRRPGRSAAAGGSGTRAAPPGARPSSRCGSSPGSRGQTELARCVTPEAARSTQPPDSSRSAAGHAASISASSPGSTRISGRAECSARAQVHRGSPSGTIAGRS